MQLAKCYPWNFYGPEQTPLPLVATRVLDKGLSRNDVIDRGEGVCQVMTVDDRGEGGLAYLVRPADVISVL